MLSKKCSKITPHQAVMSRTRNSELLNTFLSRWKTHGWEQVRARFSPVDQEVMRGLVQVWKTSGWECRFCDLFEWLAHFSDAQKDVRRWYIMWGKSTFIWRAADQESPNQRPIMPQQGFQRCLHHGESFTLILFTFHTRVHFIITFSVLQNFSGVWSDCGACCLLRIWTCSVDFRGCVCCKHNPAC